MGEKKTKQVEIETAMSRQAFVQLQHGILMAEKVYQGGRVQNHLKLQSRMDPLDYLLAFESK